MEQSQPKKKSRTKVAQHEGQLNLNPTFKTRKRKEVELMKRRPKPEGHLKLGTIPKVHIKQKGETLDPTWSRKRKNLVQKLTNLLLFEKLCSRGSENLIRKSWYSCEEEERGHMIEIQDLFGPNRGTHKKPQLVIIEGAAGIGKSTLARQVKRAWKEGQLYRNHFQHVFFLSCRELAQYEQLSLAELIAQGQEVPTVPIRQILSHPKELLFILDGIDEPAWVLADQNPELCLHWSQRQPVHTLLGSLLGKSILPGASFLLTARTTALQKIIPYVGQPRRVEVLGFSKFEREVYFRKYFVKESDAIAAFRLVVSNPVLLTLCEVPWVCWLVCTCLKKQMEQGGELSLTSQTTTALCLKYLSLTIPGQHMRTQLRALCSLAAEGICQRRTLFSESDLCKQGLAEDAIATFLKIGILQKQASSLSYSFAHLCLQEFFAVMSYILEDSDERCDGMEFKRTVETLIEVYGRHTLCEEPTVHFLFGLVNEQGMREMKKIFDCKLPLGTELKMLKSTLGNPTYQHHLGLLHCLYESQEEVLLTYVLCNLHLTGPDKNYMEATVSQTNVKHLVIQTDMELMVVTFCIQFCCHVRSLRVNMKGQQGHKLTVASMVLYRWTPITNASWKILFYNLKFNSNLEGLDLSGNPLSYSAVQYLCDAMIYPGCQLKTLCSAVESLEFCT
uniref:Isoform 3 of NACHT, LRR and PYD domains-containing protein 1b allele 2 n=1 Tax=Mus musculus TaxID=10090 RepID=A1Z198-3|nr:NACHT-, LRR-, and PYD-containing protein 1 paralog b splice variant 2 [Mus musculus]